MPFRIHPQGIRQLKELEKAAGKAERKIEIALVRAVNLGARKGRTESSKAIRSEIAFKAAYVNERLKVTKKANRFDKSATITGRDRSTQLIRFSTPKSIEKLRDRKGKTKKQIARMRARVRVKKGGALKKVKYFWVPLRNGNEGIAYRVGGKFATGSDKFKVVYGPSVDQAFSNVFDDVEPVIYRTIDEELGRQFKVLFDG